MSETEDTPVNTFNSEEKYTARVKWFNNRSGYGFATVTGGERNGEDVFVHHSGITVDGEQYKYLVQGEYVDFLLVRSEKDKHEYHATDITGVSNGPILCETRSQATTTDKSGNKYKSILVRPTSPEHPPDDANESA